MSETLNAQDIAKKLQEQLTSLSATVDTHEVSTVDEVGDGIARVSGLKSAMAGELLEFKSSDTGETVFGLAQNLDRDEVGAVLFGAVDSIKEGDECRTTGRVMDIPVSRAMLGRVVNPLGQPIDGLGDIVATHRRPIEFKAPGVIDRTPVCEPVQTGLLAIDSMVPIGRGQRELIIGDRQIGKTAIAIDTIINQRQNYEQGKPVYCIYVAIGQKASSIASLVNTLKKYGAMDYTVVVAASASDSAAMRYYSPFAGAAIGEFFRDSGRDALIVYDDLSKQAVAYRELSLILKRPSGREAYPGDIFYLHSRLLERAAKIIDNDEVAKSMNDLPEALKPIVKGGGSLTALPIIETQAGDVSAYIPTNVISITDGQIFLDTELFYAGQRPAINVGLSVSRVGSAAQTKLMKQVSASLRMRLAQYRELSGFAQFGADVDADTQKTLDAGVRMMTALRQRRFSPLEDWQEALLIFAVAEGFADSVPVPEFRVFESELYAYFETKEPQLRDVLATGAKMTDDVTARVRGALATFAGECVWQGSNN